MMKNLGQILTGQAVVRRYDEREKFSHLPRLLMSVPGLSSFLQRTLNAPILDSPFFHVVAVDEIHDIIIATSRYQEKSWQLGCQRTVLVGQGERARCYRFYLVPASSSAPVVNLRKFACRITTSHQRTDKGVALRPHEKISFARLRPQDGDKLRLEEMRLFNDEHSMVPCEFMRFVTDLERVT